MSNWFVELTAPMREGLAKRLEKKSSLTSSGCMLWSGSVNKDGYGRVSVGGRPRYAHRASWVASRGDIPHGMNVLHRCDTPAYINPDHLFLGSQKDNSADMISKSRHVGEFGNLKPRSFMGESNGFARATPDLVISIREDAALGVSMRDLARIYRLGRTTVRHIVNRETWRHVA
jgi:HNH endonuclease